MKQDGQPPVHSSFSSFIPHPSGRPPPMTGRLNSLWFRLLLGYFIPLALFLGAALVAYVTIQRLLDALHREDIAQKIFTEAYRLKEGLVGMAAAKATHHLVPRDQ